jgi:TRAP transporter TAXI family solute receptor
MGNGGKRAGIRARDIVSTWGLAIAVLIAGFVVAYQFVEPAPPKRIVLATGVDGGAYQRFGEEYAAYLQTAGIEVELRTTEGSVENLALLRSGGEIDLAFVQGGIAGSEVDDRVLAIGSLYLEPVWLFVDNESAIATIGDLQGKRIALGTEGSGTRAVATKLLAAHGIDSNSAEFVGIALDELDSAFTVGSIDAAFLVAAPESEYVSALFDRQDLSLQSLERTDAYVRQLSYLSKVDLPQGVIDLRSNKPDTDVQTVALTAMLATTDDLHPALIDLFLLAATHIHGQHSLLADAGEFPTPRFIDLPLSEGAERYFRRGPPFLMRYLPFWAATLIDRLWVMLFPVIGLAIPLVKVIPPAYRWQIRRRLLRLYSELEQIDPYGNGVRDAEDLAERLQQLEELDNDSIIASVPRGYTDDVYKLRRDIDLVRRRLTETDPA